MQRSILTAALLVFACSGGAAGPAGTPTVQFQERAAAAGMTHLHWDGTLPGGGGTAAFLANLTAGVAVGDYNGDGRPDLYVTRLFAPNLLYHNRGDGTFDERGAALGLDLSAFSTGCLWTDINNDGRLDLYVLTAELSSRNYLYVQQPDGKFEEEAVLRGLDLPAWLTATRNFTSACAGDYNLDGALDVVVTEWSGNFARNLLMENDGRGFFTDVSEARGIQYGASFGFSPALIDIDLDDWPELAIAGDYGTSKLYHNQGGNFVRRTMAAGVGTDENGMGSAWGDYDGDGWQDWFVSSIYDPNDTCATTGCSWGTTGNRLYRRAGPLLFTDATDAGGVRDGGWGWGSSFFDCENDGDLDLVLNNGVVFADTTLEDVYNTDRVRIWINDGSGAMSEQSAALGVNETRSGKGLAVLDYDGDGDLDIFLANTADTPAFLENQTTGGHHWLRLALRGHRSNRLGIGARISVTATPGAAPQVIHAQLNSNYMSHNEHTPHVGLGAVTSVHEVSVYWPVSGFTQTFANVAADQTLPVEEPCGGDVTGDGAVDLSDLALLLVNFGKTSAVRSEGDLNWDASVDLGDLALLLATFGENCQ